LKTAGVVGPKNSIDGGIQLRIEVESGGVEGCGGKLGLVA